MFCVCDQFRYKGTSMKNYRLTILGLVISVITWVVTIAFELDLFERMNSVLEDVEEYEIDELIIPLFIFSFFTLADSIRRRKYKTVELEKIKIYRAMMASTHHILNNFLNQMQLFKMTADRTPGFSPEILSLYEQIISEASRQIEDLGNITSISESEIENSIIPKK